MPILADIFLIFFLIGAIFSFVLAVFWLWNVYKTGVPHIPTSWSMARRITKLAEQELGTLKNKNVTDLGCGGGRILKIMKKKGANVTGYEKDLYGRIICRMRGIKCENTDFFAEDLAKYDLLITYLFPEIMEKVEKELWDKLPSGKILLSHQFPLPNTKPKRIWQETWKKVYVYEK